MTTTRATLVSALLVFAALPLRAQIVFGVLTDSSTGTPVSGALVSAENSAGVRVASILSGRDGAYTLPLGAAGTYQVSVRRIGLRPSNPASVTLTVGERVQQNFALSHIAMTLQAVTVNERSVCGERVSGTSASRQLLGEFLSALQSLAASAQQSALTARVTNYVQHLDPRTQIVQVETTHVAQGAYRTPFTSATAADLAANGFARVLPGPEILFLAPDPAVLASSVFVERHCFKAVPLPDEPGLAGLFIEPAPGVRTPDIEGIARFDIKSLELRSLSFRYVNAPREAGTVPTTGFVEFARRPTGTWWVNAWHITAPMYSLQIAGNRPGRAGASDVLGLHRGGGLVEAEGLPMRSGTLRVSSAGAAMNDSAVVVLSGTEHVVRQNAAGDFDMQRVVPGRYLIAVTRPTGQFVRGALAFDTVAVSAGDSVARVLTLTDRAYGTKDALCGAGSRGESRGAIAIQVFDPRGQRVRSDYEVVLIGERQTGASASGYSVKSFRKPVLTDANGIAWLCDREENETFFLVDSASGSMGRLLLGKIRRHEILLKHVTLPMQP